jgi:hypothetical protein
VLIIAILFSEMGFCLQFSPSIGVKSYTFHGDVRFRFSFILNIVHLHGYATESLL